MNPTGKKNDRTWFITGCSTGFGRLIAEELIRKNQCVAMTARDPKSLAELAQSAPDRTLALKLDVTKPDQITSAVEAALRKFGRIDVLVNNAGYGTLGALEEMPLHELRRVFETNVFGLAAVTQAVLPSMRKQRSGHILNLSSIAGFCATPGFSAYNASKFAVEGLSESLAAEVAAFGIRVTIVEPGPFRTDFISRSLYNAPKIADYSTSAVDQTRKFMAAVEGKQAGDPLRAARAMIEIVDHPSPPLRMPLGKNAVDRMRIKLKQVESEINAGEKTALSADYPEG